MLKMSRVYTLAEIFSKIFVKKRREIGEFIYDHGLTKLTTWCQFIFYVNILCDHCLHDFHIYIQKVLTNREIVNFQKWDFFDFS